MEFFKIISIFFVISGFVCAGILGIDIRKHRQPMKIMEAVWPLTGLWANWLALWAYYRFGRTKDKMNMNMPTGKHEMDMNAMPRPRWQQSVLSTLHCGAGCTLADILGEWFTFFVPIFIGSSLLAGQWVLDYILALIIGIFFQYAAIQPMEHLSVGQGLKKATKVDFLSLTAWQIGMYGWMAIFMFSLWTQAPLSKISWEYWFVMQIAMCIGFLCSLPVNYLLVKAGIKHGM